MKPGDVLFAANFAADSLGDMPRVWKTKSIGEVKTVEGRDGRWLKLDAGAKYESSFNQIMPENFKIEFDYIADYKDGQGVPELNVRAFKKGAEYREGGLTFAVGPSGGTSAEPGRVQVFTHEQGPGEIYRSEARNMTIFKDKNGTKEPVHVALSVKGQNVKAWLDGEKVYDLQEVVMPGVKFDRLGFETGTYGGPKQHFNYYISNIKIVAE